MLGKQAIELTQPSKDQFLSTIFLVTKKDTGHRPVPNLKKLNQYIPYKQFKKFRFNDSFDIAAMVSVESTTKRRENLDKFRTPSNNINRCFIGRLKGLLRKSKDRGPWTSQENKDHVNVLELRAVKHAILTFSRLHPKAQSIHIQMDSIVALSYLAKMGGTQNKSLTV